MDRPGNVNHRLPSTLVGCLLVGLWTFSVIAEATPENVVFRQRAEVSTTQSTWVLGFTIDLGSYGRFLAQVRDNLNLSDWLIGRAIETVNKRAGGDQIYPKLFASQQLDLASIRDGYQFCVDRYNDVRQLSNKVQRKRRSLLPWAGRILSGLFGVVSEEQLQVVLQQIQSLASNQADIVHDIEDQVSLINVTRVELGENRHAINTLIEVTRELKNRMGDTTGQIVNTLLPFKQFVVTYLQIQLHLGELRDFLSRATTYITRVEMKLNQLSLGHLSPAILPPNQLQMMLLAVRNKIPARLMLPGDPITQLWYYYTRLHCSAIVHANKLVVLVNLPLLDSSGQLEIYTIVNMPVPYPSTNLTAVYALQFQQFGISKDRTEYVILSNEEMLRCGSEELKFCSLNSPVYNVNEKETCEIAMFLRKTDQVRKLCHTKVSTEMLPLAERLGTENWLLAISKPTRFTLVCENDHGYEVEVEPPVALLYVPAGCGAVSGEMRLPIYVHGEEEFEVEASDKLLLKMSNWSALDIWQPMQNYSRLLDPINVPAELADIKGVSMSRFVKLLRKVSTAKNTGGLSSSTIVDLISGGVLVIAVVVLAFRQKFLKVIRNITRKNSASYSPANCNDIELDRVVGVGVDRLGSSDASGGRTEPGKLEGAVCARDAESVPQNTSELGF